MNEWRTFLIVQVSRLYGLSPTEEAVFLAKFSDKNNIRSNKEVADLSIEDNQLPCNTETVDKHMREIYRKLGCPQNNFEAFPCYNQKRGQKRDPELLAWLKAKYLHYLKSQSLITMKNNDDGNTNFVTNPFVPLTGVIDNPQLFFGRGRELKQIFDFLNSGSSVALIGEQGIGKSSILKAIYQQAGNHLQIHRKPIYLNLNSISDDHTFYEALCDQIGIELKKGYFLERELKNNKLLLLLLLDDVEKMTWEVFTKDVRSHLRGLAGNSSTPLIRLVVAASTPLDILFSDSQNMLSPFQGICHDVNIEPWDESICRDFITARLGETNEKNIFFTKEKIDYLINESGGNPRKLMQLCYQAYSQYAEAIQ